MPINRILIKTFFLGGVTFIAWPLLYVVEKLKVPHAVEIQLSVVAFFTVSALIFYQPHFISTYYFNYSRGKEFIREHSWSLIVAPLGIIAMLVVAYVQLLPFNLLGWLYLVAVVWATSHFAHQALAASVSADSERLARGSRLRRAGAFTLGSFAVYGLLRMLDLHNGAVSLFGLRSAHLYPPVMLQKIAIVIASASLAYAGVIAWREKIRLAAVIPFLAFIVWYSQDIFLGKYFYFIPVFHGLQYVPFYFKRIRSQRGWIGISAGIILLSLALVQVIPESLSSQGMMIFPSILLFYNIHHFIMESITWKRFGNSNHDLTGAPKS